MITKVWVLMHETSIQGIYSSKDKLIEYHAKANDMSIEEAANDLAGGNYPAIEEVNLDTPWWRDR